MVEARERCSRAGTSALGEPRRLQLNSGVRRLPLPMDVPSEIRVTVLDRAGQPIPAVLVWLNTRALGGDYWRTLLGLTDHHGTVCLSGDQLRRHFREEQAFSLMDLRVPLEECDEEVTLGVEGGAVFRDHREIALTADWVAPWAKQYWSEARNETLTSATLLVPVPDGGAPVEATVRLDAVEALSSRPAV